MKLKKYTATTLLLLTSTWCVYASQQADNGIAAGVTNSPATQRNDPKRQYKPKLGSGTLTGIVERVEPIDGKAEFLWVKSKGVMHQFDIVRPNPAVIVGGDISKKGTRVRVTYRNLELSEMDYFYYGNAVRVVTLKK